MATATYPGAAGFTAKTEAATFIPEKRLTLLSPSLLTLNQKYRLALTSTLNTHV